MVVINRGSGEKLQAPPPHGTKKTNGLHLVLLCANCGRYSSVRWMAIQVSTDGCNHSRFAIVELALWGLCLYSNY